MIHDVYMIFSTVNEGQNFTNVVDVTDTDNESDLTFYYVERNNVRIIKLPKHDDGNGICYHGTFLPQCKSHNFTLSYEKYGNRKRSLRFTIQRAVAGRYELMPYYDWVGNISDYVDPLMNFTLFIKGETNCCFCQFLFFEICAILEYYWK